MERYLSPFLIKFFSTKISSIVIVNGIQICLLHYFYIFFFAASHCDFYTTINRDSTQKTCVVSTTHVYNK
ncbi:hypothetical protein SGHV159 [Glossina pallidipes salivary gland hypertrophy virus]|uniref:Uncharacterized protein n=1 Tax=Glossina hytrovirus (isolate Glossina pallidipes/Ethiopia/Seibersdorf/-) TaxID=379529 RepID=B0YLW3_GHVS|nr:hypothetical protein SGHV159 [Glossina pallidipes salivary gland hypertrophy virus]ABQ08932.1 hypothetical protein SGHV159 [Glossina pallidipes salivary gland hypertrophy virus]